MEKLFNSIDKWSKDKRTGLDKFIYKTKDVDFEAFFLSKDDVNPIFVLDYKYSKEFINPILIIKKNAENPEEKWDKILQNKYKLSPMNIRPKEENKYLKLDIIYDGINLYRDFIEMPDSRIAKKIKHNKLENLLDVCKERLDFLNLDLKRAKTTILTSTTTLDVLNISLEKHKSSLVKILENPKVDGFSEKEEKERTKIFEIEDKIKSAKRRIKRAEKREEVESEEIIQVKKQIHLIQSSLKGIKPKEEEIQKVKIIETKKDTTPTFSFPIKITPEKEPIEVEPKKEEVIVKEVIKIEPKKEVNIVKKVFTPQISTSNLASKEDLKETQKEIELLRLELEKSKKTKDEILRIREEISHIASKEDINHIKEELHKNKSKEEINLLRKELKKSKTVQKSNVVIIRKPQENETLRAIKHIAIVLTILLLSIILLLLINEESTTVINKSAEVKETETKTITELNNKKNRVYIDVDNVQVEEEQNGKVKYTITTSMVQKDFEEKEIILEDGRVIRMKIAIPSEKDVIKKIEVEKQKNNPSLKPIEKPVVNNEIEHKEIEPVGKSILKVVIPEKDLHNITSTDGKVIMKARSLTDKIVEINPLQKDILIFKTKIGYDTGRYLKAFDLLEKSYISKDIKALNLYSKEVEIMNSAWEDLIKSYKKIYANEDGSFNNRYKNSESYMYNTSIIKEYIENYQVLFNRTCAVAKSKFLNMDMDTLSEMKLNMVSPLRYKNPETKLDLIKDSLKEEVNNKNTNGGIDE